MSRRVNVAATIRGEREDELQSRESELSADHTRLVQLSRELQSLRDELAQSRALVAQIYSSGSWRITLPLRFLRHIADVIRRRSVRLAERLGVDGLLGHPIFSDGTNSGGPKAHLPLPLKSRLRLPFKIAGRPDTVPRRAASTVPKTELRILERSGLFDEQFYCEAYPDVATGEISPLEHYLFVGAFEGRRPNRLFDSAYYLSTYPDVAQAAVNPALHYFLTGALEGRNPSAEFDTSYYVEANPDVVTSEINPLVHFLRFGLQEGHFPRRECYERELQKLGRLAAARHRQDKLDYRPLISVLMRTDHAEPIHLEAAVRSAMAQAYSNWELRIVDDGSSNSATCDALGRVAAWDKRIFVIRVAGQGIANAWNCALQDACGEYVAMLGHDDELAFDALYEVALILNTDWATDVVYTDEDYVSPGGEPTTHLFKPDWSPALFRGVMYVGRLLIVRRSLALEVGGFESAFGAVQDFEFMLRISERTRKIRHIPKALYRCRRIPESVAQADKANGGVEQLQAAAVQAHLGRLGLAGSARPHPQHSRRVIIEPVGGPQDNNFDLIFHCGAIPMARAKAINSALARTAHRPARIAVPAAWSGVETVANITVDRRFDDARRLSDAERLNRFLTESAAKFVLAMSAGVTIETDGWLERLMVAMQECEVVVVCPVVLSADRLVAHAGLIAGSDGNVAPAMRGLTPEADGYVGSLSCAREISAAWADVVLLRRSALASLLLANPVYSTADYLVADLTLRATRAGLRALCVPYVRARQTVKTEADEARRLDALLFQDHWACKAVVDPFYRFVETRCK